MTSHIPLSQFDQAYLNIFENKQPPQDEVCMVCCMSDSRTWAKYNPARRSPVDKPGPASCVAPSGWGPERHEWGNVELI